MRSSDAERASETWMSRCAGVPARRDDLIEERMFPIFPWFPPQDQEIDGARWVEALQHGFHSFDPAVV